MLNRKGLVRSSTTFSTPSVIGGHHAEAMSALPPKADIANGRRSVQAVSSVKHEYLERGECQQGLALLWQIYSRRCALQIHFRQCGHRCGDSRAKSSRMAWRTAGKVG